MGEIMRNHFINIILCLCSIFFVVKIARGESVDWKTKRIAKTCFEQSSTLQHLMYLESRLMWDKAMEGYDKILQDKSNHFAARIGRSRIFVKLGRTKEAIGELEFLRKEMPQCIATYPRLADLYAEQKKFTKELEVLLEYDAIATEYDPYLKSRIAELQGNLDLAEKILQQFVQNSPVKVRMYGQTHLGEFYERQGRLKDAKIQYTEAKKLIKSGYPAPLPSKNIKAALERLKNQ